MAVLRKNKKDHYTVIDNTVFFDKTISYKAKGLLCQMLSLPDGWEWSVEGLTSLSSDGVSAVRSALNELEEAGYFRRQQIRKDNKIAGVEYIISETRMCENLMSENLILENLISENPPQLNTNSLTTNSSTTDNNTFKSEFDELWELYPRKQGKDGARKSYVKARKDGASFEEVRKGLESYREFVKDTDPQYICMGSTWFNQHRWEDDYDIGRGNKERGGVSSAVGRNGGSTKIVGAKLPGLAPEIFGEERREDND